MGAGCYGISALKAHGEIEVQKLVESGDAANRCCIVLLGDGYVSEQRELFLEDAQRYAEYLTQAPTFKAFAPLFNVSAVFVPSAEAGISTRDRHRDTAFGLSRLNDRLIGMKNSILGYYTARAACRLAGKCDFFVLIGNDDYYGGVACEDHVLVTRSRSTGWITLRHELGHIFAEVGEEYDGGWCYRGANSTPKLKVPWAHWLTDPSLPITRQRACQRLCKHKCDEIAAGKWSFNFSSDGTYARWILEFSVRHGSVCVALDGQELLTVPVRTEGIELFGDTELERQMFSCSGDTTGLATGPHCLEFSRLPGASTSKLSFVELVEYGSEDEFRMEPGYIGAYPTWDATGHETYRPTHNLCLMRNVHSEVLCPVCKEAVWHKLLTKASLIDAVEVIREESGRFSFAVRLLALEHLEVDWARDGAPMEELRGEVAFSLPEGEARGRWVVTVAFRTPEVRKDAKGKLKTQRSFIVS
mmetsp:Transcript_52368/g.132356  ORF Transcript_52368/g.132356 Transcript_52368/m.132356 type:complete len:472 (-) Transcript_52368:317-1732(-)